MWNTGDGRVRRLIATAGGLAALGVAALGSLAVASDSPEAGAPERGVTGCSTAAVPAAESSMKQLRKAVRCLINQERAIHGFSRLKKSAPLQAAAQSHTKTMVATGCLAH